MGMGCQSLEWSFDALRRKVMFRLTSSNEDDEWVAVGVSENGGMKGADNMHIVKEVESGFFVVDDAFSMNKERPVSDTVQNIKLLDAKRDEDGRLVAVIERDVDMSERAICNSDVRNIQRK